MDDAPPIAGRFLEVLSRWLAKSSYRIPVRWDPELGEVVLGRSHAVHVEQLKDEGGFDRAMVRATEAVADWHRTWEDERAFRSASGVVQDDLIQFFGKAPWQPTIVDRRNLLASLEELVDRRNPRCWRCGVHMVAGRADGLQRPAPMAWVDDPAVASGAGAESDEDAPRMRIVGYRCLKCGLLELYAR